MQSLRDSCGPTELARHDTDGALEVVGTLALVREAGAGGDLRQGEVTAALQKPLGPVDTARGELLAGAVPVAGLNCRAKW